MDLIFAALILFTYFAGFDTAFLIIGTIFLIITVIGIIEGSLHSPAYSVAETISAVLIALAFDLPIYTVILLSLCIAPIFGLIMLILHL